MSEQIPHWLDKQAELNPERVAVETSMGELISFSDLRKRSRGMAQSLIDSGVNPGDHVAFLSDNSPHFPVFIHAISYVGAIAVLLNTRLTAPEISFQLKDAHISHFYIGRGYENVAYESADGLELEVKAIEDVPIMNELAHPLRSELALDEVYTMMYTSGTTGNPKAVMHTYGNHWYSAIASALNLGISSADKWLICLPLFHVGGFSVLMKSVIYGMSTHLLEKFDAHKVHDAIMAKGVTHVSVVTVMLQRLLEQLEGRTYPEDFRCMLLGGGPVPESLLQKTSERNIPVFQTYGMTETSSQIATLSPDYAFSKIGSAGKALSLAELKIDSPEKGDVGEILVRGPMVSNGYFNRTNENVTYLHTGDLGYEDEDGFLYVVDRVKDVIISGGENVYPAEVESVLSEIAGVREAGVAGRRDEAWGEVPVAFLVTDTDVTEEDVLIFCNQRLAKYKNPAEIHFVDILPRNASNKILRRKLFTLLDGEATE